MSTPESRTHGTHADVRLHRKRKGDVNGSRAVRVLHIRMRHAMPKHGWSVATAMAGGRGEWPSTSEFSVTSPRSTSLTLSRSGTQTRHPLSNIFMHPSLLYAVTATVVVLWGTIRFRRCPEPAGVAIVPLPVRCTNSSSGRTSRNPSSGLRATPIGLD